MATVKLNPILEQLRGKVGDLVFKRYGDGTVVSRTPDFSDHEPTEAQLAHRDRFRQATVYGRVVMADEEARAVYEAAAETRGKPIFSLTVADFFNAPSVDEIDVSGYTGASGDPIVVRASDDVDVQRVVVALTDADGAALESGEAAADAGHWVYTAQTDVAPGTTVRIGVQAVDRPGGVGEDDTEIQTPA
ncbi:hypothetical protein [Rubrivirga sp. IMCC45206]|uniref:hypothetical protein n=1 Tax=Rubrivirga sp. IMCC45206 TaxID=3391614 RepID=UPI003990281E